MSALFLYGDLDGVPLDEAKVRATTGPVDKDAPAAEATGAPEFAEVETDQSPLPSGLAHRMLASFWHPRQQSAPGIMADLATTPHNVIVDQQISTSGTAAARELAGQRGPGTIPYAEGIEPVIRDGAAFDNTYFAAGKRDIQEAQIDDSRGVRPNSGLDRADIMGAATYGSIAARDASASAYQAAFGGS